MASIRNNSRPQKKAVPPETSRSEALERFYIKALQTDTSRNFHVTGARSVNLYPGRGDIIIVLHDAWIADAFHAFATLDLMQPFP